MNRGITLALSILLLAILLAWQLSEPEESVPDSRHEARAPHESGALLVPGNAQDPEAAHPTEARAPHADSALRGTVHDESDRPLPFAQVLYSRVWGPGAPEYENVSASTRHATTDRDGRYRIELEPGSYAIRARMDDLESRRHDVRIPRSEPLHLRVGVPPSRLVIRLLPMQANTDLDGLEVRVSASRGRIEATHSRGEFSIAGLHPGDVVSISVALESEDRGLAVLPSPSPVARYQGEWNIRDRRMHASVEMHSAEEVVEFPVVRLARITGRLVLPGAQAAPPGAYSLECRQPSIWQPTVDLVPSLEHTGYSVWVLPERPASIFVHPTTLSDSIVGLRSPILLAPLGFGEEATMDVELQVMASHVLSGQVVDVDGFPASATVRIGQSLEAGLASGAADAAPFRWGAFSGTDASGVFEIRGVVRAATVVTVDAGAGAQGVGPLPAVLEDWSGDVIWLGIIPLKSGGTIAGTLQAGGQTGQGAVETCRIRVVPEGRGGEPVLPLRDDWAARTDCRSGARFRVEGLPPAVYRLLGPGPLDEVWRSPLGKVLVSEGETVEVTVRFPGT